MAELQEMSYLEPSDFTVAEFVKMLEKMPQDAKVYLTYEGYYEGSGGIDEPHVDKNGRVVVGEVYANY
jgi:hypothetical protein